MEITTEILIWSFGIAMIMGAVANKTNFCTMGAVSDWVNMGDTNRLRSWFLAITVALGGVLVLETTGSATVDPSLPPYRNASFAWLRYLVGGLLFGIGMVYTSGCGNKVLVRIGGGNIKSIFVLGVAAFFAYLMTKTSFYEQLFFPWVNATTIDLTEYGMNSQDLGGIVGGIAGAEDVASLRTWIGAALVVILLVILFKSSEFRKGFDNLLGGIVMGGAVIAAWFITGGAKGEAWKEAADFMDVVPVGVATQSYTFINPMGDTLYYLMSPGNYSLISFGVAALAGVIAGSFLYAILFRQFRVEWFSSIGDFVRHIIGGVLIGTGGVLSMGCTIGQGVTGVSTLAIGSMLTLASIIVGAALTMKIQFYKMVYEEEATFMKALLSGMADLKLLPSAMRKLDPV
ncbi:MAG: YeeE/YedE family protein [bacterium]